MRIAPLIAVIVVVVFLGSALGSGLLWFISIASMLGLAVIIYLSIKQNKFVGPKVLVDDAREKLREMGRDRTEETYEVEVQTKDDDNA